MEPIAAGEVLSQPEARQYFEFFTSTTRAEVLLVGEPLVYHVHKVTGITRRLLCAGDDIVSGYRCRLCESSKLPNSNVATSSEVHFVPAFVRRRKGGPFCPRVAAFPQGAGRALAEEIGFRPARGLRMFVERQNSKRSGRIVFDRFYRMPRGFPACLPEAFDPVPLIRAYYGLPSTPVDMPPNFVVEKVTRRSATRLAPRFVIPEIETSWPVQFVTQPVPTPDPVSG